MAYSVDLCPTAEASYARTLVERGCPASLAACAARVLAREEDPESWSSGDEAIVAQAYAALR